VIGALLRAAATPVQGRRRYGTRDRAVWWAGRAQEDGGRVCPRSGPNGARTQHVQTFGTTAGELLALRDWLEAHGVAHVAMESTSVYWKPVFYVLEEAFSCLLANAAHIAQEDRRHERPPPAIAPSVAPVTVT